MPSISSHWIHLLSTSGVSFAQKGQDLQELIDIMDRMKIPQEKRPKICPKIEKPQAFTNIDGIIAKSQVLPALMVSLFQQQ